MVDYRPMVDNIDPVAALPMPSHDDDDDDDAYAEANHDFDTDILTPSSNTRSYTCCSIYGSHF